MAVLPSAPTYFGTGGLVSGAGSALTPTYPASVAANDIGILVVTAKNQTISLSTASGYVQIGSQLNQATGSLTSLSVYWVRFASSSPASPVVSSNTSNQTAQIYVFRGCSKDSNPYDVTGTSNQTATTAVSVAGATSLQQYELIAVAISYNVNSATPQSSGWTNANLSGLTLQSDTSTAAGGGQALATGGGLAGATGLAAWGATTATLATSSVVCGMSIALKPQWTVDAATTTTPKIFPAGPNEFTDFLTACQAVGLCSNWSIPDVLCGCQDASGNVTDQSGNGHNLVPTGTPGYHQTATGYSRKAISTSTDSTVVLANTDASLPDLSTGSCLGFLVADDSAAGGSNREICSMGTTTAVTIQVTSTPRMQITSGANTATGTITPVGSYKPFFLQSDTTNAVTRGLNDVEVLSPTRGSPSGQKIAIGDSGAATTPAMTVLSAWWWFNSHAERSLRDFAELEVALGWTRSWTTAFTSSVAEAVAAPSDSSGRAIAVGRGVGETVPTPSDSAARVAAWVRTPSETLSAPIDSVSRIVAASRAPAESLSVPADSASRVFVAARGIGESVPTPADDVARSATAARGMAESVPQPADTPTRSVAMARAVSESMLAPLDQVFGVHRAPVGSALADDQGAATPSADQGAASPSADQGGT